MVWYAVWCTILVVEGASQYFFIDKPYIANEQSLIHIMMVEIDKKYSNGLQMQNKVRKL